MTPRETITQHNRDIVSLSQYGDALVGMTLGNDPTAMYDFDLMVAYFKNPDWAGGDGRDGESRKNQKTTVSMVGRCGLTQDCTKRGGCLNTRHVTFKEVPYGNHITIRNF